MCIWYDIDFPGGARDISGQSRPIGRNWMGYCAEECDKITDCTAMTVGNIVFPIFAPYFPLLSIFTQCFNG